MVHRSREKACPTDDCTSWNRLLSSAVLVCELQSSPSSGRACNLLLLLQWFLSALVSNIGLTECGTSCAISHGMIANAFALLSFPAAPLECMVALPSFRHALLAASSSPGVHLLVFGELVEFQCTVSVLVASPAFAVCPEKHHIPAILWRVG